MFNNKNQNYELAQKQGNDSIFTYYTFDNKNMAEKPHIHICSNDKEWQEIMSNNGYKTVATVDLEPPYDFIKIYDNKIAVKNYKTMIITWLTALKKLWNGKILNLTNAENALNDYILSNNKKGKTK